jgi:hypothetical protein
MTGSYTWAFTGKYRSPVTIGSLPLVHITSGIDPITMRPRIAKGVIAIGASPSASSPSAACPSVCSPPSAGWPWGSVSRSAASHSERLRSAASRSA